MPVYGSGSERASKLETIEDFERFAELRGIKLEKKEKTSLFRKTIDILQRPNYAVAGFAGAFTERGKAAGENPLQELWDGFTGREKETFSDVLKDVGVENKYARGITGFALDVVLDPTTYLGGPLIKGAAKTTGALAKGAAKTTAGKAFRSIPQVRRIETAAKTVREALGEAFVFGHGAPKGFADDVAVGLNKLGIKKEDVINKYTKSFGAKFNKYNSDEIIEAGDILMKNRVIEKGVKEGADNLTQQASKYKTAEEFVNAQPKVFHGTSAENALKIKKEGIKPGTPREITEFGTRFGNEVGFSVSKDKNISKNFGEKVFKDGVLLEFTISKSAKIAKGKDIPDRFLQEFPNGDILFNQGDVVKWAKKNGFDAVDLDDITKTRAKHISDINPFDDKELQIINPDILKTKSQLTDIFNKAGTSGTKFITPKDPKINEIVEKLKTHGAEIAEEAGLPLDKVYKNYFPAIAKDRTRDTFGSALKPKESGGTQKWNNVLKIGDDALDNPIEALARRELEVGRFNINKGTIESLVEGYGSKTAKEGLERVTMKEFKNGKLVEKTMGFLPKKAKSFMNDMLYPEMKTVDMLAKASGYDAFTNFFKTAVTAWFPAFHIRNAASGIVQNYSVLGAQALNPKNFMDGLAVMKKANKQFLFKGFNGTAGELRGKMAERFGVSSRFISDLGDYVTELADGTFKLKNMAKLNPRRFGNWIEMNQKANATVTALRSGKSLDEAFKLAEKAGFDYSKITNFEAKIMKRVIPFYSFARKNAELQAKTFAKNPERILNQVKFTNLLSNIFGGEKPTEEDLNGLPPWALNAMGFKLEDGKYVSRFGLPMEEFIERVADPVKTSLTSMNPLIKFPLEAQTGFDFFREKQIEDITSVKEPTAKAIMNHGPQWLKDAFNVTSYEYKGETKYKADPDALHVLRNIPISRFLNTFDKMAQDGVLEVTPEKAASFIIGAQLYSIDQDLQKYFSDRELISDYQKQLEQQGVGWDYSQFFGK